jgi:hypothetical protein
MTIWVQIDINKYNQDGLKYIDERIAFYTSLTCGITGGKNDSRLKTAEEEKK